MKNIKLLIALTLLLTSCTKSDEILDEPIANNARTFVASIEDNQTRVHIEGLSIYWDDNDRISILDGTNNVEYAYSYQNEENTFSPITQTSLNEGDVYAVYPYNASNSVDANGVITLTFPETQSYAENSFGQGANTMVAQSNGDKLSFKNVGAYLKLKLWGENVKVKSITFAGNNEEQLSGAANVKFGDDGIPTYEWVSTQSSDNKTITLNCPNEGVALSTNSGEPTYFWLVVPPQTFSGGFTITVTDIEGKEYVKSTTREITLERNWIQPMAALEVETEGPQNGEIWYYDENDEKGVLNIADDYISVQNFLPIYINTETLEPSGENLTARAAITNILIPENVTSIDMAAFAFCTNLESVVLHDGVTSIGMGAFAFCTKLESINIPGSVVTLGELSFAYSGLEEVQIPSSVERIGTAAFWNTNVKSVTIPNSVTGGLNSTFYGCTSLTEVVLSENIVELGNSTFESCVSLQNITIPASVEEIEESVFEGCTSLKTVTFAPSSKLRMLFNNSFRDCVSLTSIALPASLGNETLEDNPSSDFACNTEEAESNIYGGLGTPIKGDADLGGGVFQGCTNLKTVYSLSETALRMENLSMGYPFPYENTGFKVYVPNDAALTAYKADANWSAMGERIQVGTPPMP